MRVSIITPTYNRATFLDETIESVLSQDYTNIEYIVIDDGSKDNTSEVVKKYDKVEYHYHDNIGESKTVNAGYALASGEIILIVNSDDPLYSNHAVSEAVDIFRKYPEVVAVYPDWVSINIDGNVISEVRLPEFTIENMLRDFNCALGPGMFIRREALEKIGYRNTEIKYTGDLDVSFRLALLGKLYHIPKLLATHREHKNALSSTSCGKEMALEVFRLANEAYFCEDKLSHECQRSKIKNLENAASVALKFAGNNKSILNELSEVFNKEIEKHFLFKNLQVGDNDLIGNKFNGHDLHLYLRENGIDSSHLVWNKESNDKSTFVIAGEKNDRNHIQQMALEIQARYRLNSVVNPIAYDILNNKLFLEADIIHFHLIHNFIFDLQLLPLMSRLKPIVWSLHDPWALSGHCVHHFECEKWKKQCGDCQNLKVPFELGVDNSALNFALKRDAIRNSNLEIIVASDWMKRKVEQSPIFEGKKINVIPFGINQDIFCPNDKSEARKKLKVAEDSLVISFRCDPSEFKGLDIIEYTLKRIKADKKIVLLVLANKLYKKQEKFEVKEFGWVKDDNLLAQIYSASDIFLMPSKVESFGMMAIEAMSCGTLPIVLEGTALPDTVNAPECGVATKQDKGEYLKAVQHYIDNEEEREMRAEKCLEFARDNYNKSVYIERILEVYKEAMEKHVLAIEDHQVLDQLKKYMITEPIVNIEPIININQSENLHKIMPIKFSSNTKNVIRAILRKIIFYVSPTFRMLSGNRHRMNILLEKIENLEGISRDQESAILDMHKQQSDIFLEKLDKIEKINEQRVSAVLENKIRKEYLPKPYDENINLLGERVFIADNHKSLTKYYKISIIDFLEKLKKNILKTDVILDIGCGIRPQTFFTPKIHICVEPFKQYREVVEPLFPNSSHFVFLKEDALTAVKTLDDNSVDAVFMIDLIEHLEKEDGLELLKEADRIARKQIVVFTPLGFYPMDFKEENQKDAWGLDGNDGQEHKSGWLPEDFGESWDFHICEDCHDAFLSEEKEQGKKYSALMAIKTKNFKGFPIMDETPEFVKNVYRERIVDNTSN